MSRPALLSGTMATGRSAGICVRSSRTLLTTRCQMATVDARLQQEGNLDLVSRGGNPIRNARTALWAVVRSGCIGWRCAQYGMFW
jgi:hypothetical protein